MRYEWVPMPWYAWGNGSYGMCNHPEGLITYSDPLALAHEVGHAIEMRLKGRTSEYGAWKLAYSFLKPKYWQEDVARAAYDSYVQNGRHKVEVVLEASGMYRYKPHNNPNILDFIRKGKKPCRQLRLPGIR